LDTFITDITGVLEAEELTDVVLVGHSFGAVPVFGAADRMPERLRRLVLLDGLIPTPGQYAFDALPADLVADRVRLAEEFSGGLSLPPSPAAVFAVTDPADVDWLQRRLTPQPLRTYTDQLELTNPLGNGLPCTYFACTDPPYAPATRSHEQARAQGEWEYREISAGHDAMITAAGLVAHVLVELVDTASP
jgi:pimeloyl-ACP methyl ester carboxylesterase